MFQIGKMQLSVMFEKLIHTYYQVLFTCTASGWFNG